MKGLKIALVGKMRSGKDTVGNYLSEKYNFKRFAFGDGIRLVCRQLFPEIIVKGKPRYLYQGIGQDMRKYEPNVWIYFILRQLEETSEGDNIVITDLRQPNEYKALKENGFKIVRVNASDKVRLERMNALGDNVKPEDLNHETESHVDSYEVDFELDSNGSIDELLRQAEGYVRQFKTGRETPWEQLKSTLLRRKKGSKIFTL